MKRLDILLIVMFLLVSAALGYYFSLGSVAGEKIVEIYVDNELFKSFALPLTEEKVLELDDHGHNVVHIDGDIVWMEESDCPDQICVDDGKKSKVGDLIVCLPNKIVIEIKGHNNSGVDGIAY